MSGWTVLTVRGKYSKDYEHAEYESKDPWKATADIVATMDADDRVRSWEIIDGHVHAHLNCERYGWGFAEDLLQDYGGMLRDAVVLGANDTTDTGTAKYYPRLDLARCTDTYEETQKHDGYHVGRLACSVMAARHGIIARDPFHEYVGQLNERYLEEGESRMGD